MAVTRRGNLIEKLAADAKPTATDVQAGTELKNTDDKKSWLNSGTEWIAQDFPILKKFRVFIEGSKTYVIDIHGKVWGSATETEDAINPIMAAQPNTSTYLWMWDTDAFTFFSPVLFPTHVAGILKKNIHRSEAWSTIRSTTGGVTTVKPAATFPTNRYLFEATNAIASTTTSEVEISGFQGINVDNFATVNCGFAKLESDAPNNQYNWIVRDCYLNYMWRGVHLIGYVWYGLFQNITFTVSNTGFAGDACLILEDGSHTGANNPTPKSNEFHNIQTHNGDGKYNSFLDMKSGGYNNFSLIFVDGRNYDLGVYYLNNTDALVIHNNTFRDLFTLDLVDPASASHGSLYLKGGSVYDNIFEKCRLTLFSSKTVKLEGTGVMNNYIELDSYWGGVVPIVNHVTPGESNTIAVMAGSKTSATNLPVTLSGTAANRCRVVDTRRGAELGGTVAVADGGTITHGLMTTPVWYWVMPTVAGEMASVTAVSSTTLTVALKKHDNTAGTTQTVSWRAGVYL